MSTMQGTEQAVVNEVKSLALVGNMLRLALHNIVYIRGLFPAESFKNSTQFGMAQAKLTGDTPESQRILNMLEKGVMHAIKMKYAKTITFYITDPVHGLDDEENVLEEYVFKVRYGSRDGEVALDDITIRRGGGGKEGTAAGDGTTSAGADRSAQTTVTAGPRVRGVRRLDDEEYIKRAAANMVRSLCALIRTLEPMPAERKFSMKLTYVDETPEDYQPPFFEASDPTALVRKWRRKPLVSNIGKVETRHHQMSLQMQSVLDNNDDHDDDDVDTDDVHRDNRRNDRPGNDAQQQQQKKQKVQQQQPAAKEQPHSALPSAPQTLGESLVNEDAETQQQQEQQQEEEDQPMDDDDYHYAVPDSQPSQPVAGEREAPGAAAVRAPATPVPFCYDDSCEQQPQQRRQQRDSQPLVCSDGGDTSRATHAQQEMPAIRARVLDWMASRAPGSWVDAIAAVSDFPDVSFKILDQVLLDLSKGGVLRARGDGTYALVSSLSQGQGRLSLGRLSQGRTAGDSAGGTAGGGRGSLSQESLGGSQGSQGQRRSDAVAVGAQISNHLAMQCTLGDDRQPQKRQRPGLMTQPVTSCGGYYGQPPETQPEHDEISVGVVGSGGGFGKFGAFAPQQQRPQYSGALGSVSAGGLGGAPPRPSPPSPFGRVGSGQSTRRPSVSAGDAVTLRPVGGKGGGGGDARGDDVFSFGGGSQEPVSGGAGGRGVDFEFDFSVSRKPFSRLSSQEQRASGGGFPPASPFGRVGSGQSSRRNPAERISAGAIALTPVAFGSRAYNNVNIINNTNKLASSSLISPPSSQGHQKQQQQHQQRLQGSGAGSFQQAAAASAAASAHGMRRKAGFPSTSGAFPAAMSQGEPWKKRLRSSQMVM